MYNVPWVGSELKVERSGRRKERRMGRGGGREGARELLLK